MDIEKIVVRFFADATPFQRAVDGVENRLIGFNRTIGMLSAFGTPMVIASTVAITGLGVAAGAAAWEGLKLANAYQQANVAFSVMTGSAETGKKLLDEIIQLAIETPFNSPELIKAAQELKAFGIITDQVVPTLRMLGDVAAAVGMDKLPRIVLAYGQVRSAGRLMGPELRQFFDAGVPMIEYLAKVMGKPEQAIKGMVENAKVGFPEVVKAFKAMTEAGGIYFGMQDRQLETVQGRWNSLKETFQVYIRNVGLAVFEEFNVAEGLREWTDALGTGQETGSLRDNLRQVREQSEHIWKYIKLAAYWIEKAWNDTGEWIKQNEALVKKIGLVIVQIAAVLALIWLCVAAYTTLVAVIAFALTPIGAIVIAVTTLVILVNQLDTWGTGFRAGFEKSLALIKGLGAALHDALIGEDWDLAGRVIFKGLEIGIKTALVSIKVEILGLVAELMSVVSVELDRVMSKTGAVGKYLIERANPGVKDDDARKNYFNMLNEIDKRSDAKLKSNTEKFEAMKLVEISKALEPYKRQMEELQQQAAESRKNKELERLRLSDVYNFQMKLLNRFFEGSAEDAFQDAVHKELKARNIKQGTAEADAIFSLFGQAYRLMQPAGAIAIGAQYGFTPEGAPGPGRTAVTIPMALSPEAVQLAQRVQKEMETGTWAGQAVDRYSLFLRHMDLLDEAAFGVMGKKGIFGWGNIYGRPSAILTKSEHEFGMYEEYLNLKKSLGHEQQFPRAMFLGSQEAQDAINKAQTETRTVQEEVRDTLLEAKVIQEQQREYMRQVVEELRKIRAENGLDDLGGGGDF